MIKIKDMPIISEQISGTTINVEVQSSNLKFASYDTSTKVLTITFKNGSIYEYYEIPWALFTKFRMAKSHGKFFSKEISRNFKYKRIT
ncbi:MAG TPA: KTSC domain-containing protein [Bacilli bacterium]|nr:KTSC domain-containing protein [Bacilli bacterium]